MTVSCKQNPISSWEIQFRFSVSSRRNRKPVVMIEYYPMLFSVIRTHSQRYADFLSWFEGRESRKHLIMRSSSYLAVLTTRAGYLTVNKSCTIIATTTESWGSKTTLQSPCEGGIILIVLTITIAKLCMRVRSRADYSRSSTRAFEKGF